MEKVMENIQANVLLDYVLNINYNHAIYYLSFYEMVWFF